MLILREKSEGSKDKGTWSFDDFKATLPTYKVTRRHSPDLVHAKRHPRHLLIGTFVNLWLEKTKRAAFALRVSLQMVRIFGSSAKYGRT